MGERIPKLIMDCIPRERRKRGRPRKTWMEGVQAVMTTRNLEPDQWRGMAFAFPEDGDNCLKTGQIDRWDVTPRSMLELPTFQKNLIVLNQNISSSQDSWNSAVPLKTRIYPTRKCVLA